MMVAEVLFRQGLPMVQRRLLKAPPRDVLFEGQASLEHGGEPVRGILSVTPRRLVFTPHSVRARFSEVDLPLEAIEDVSAARSRFLGLIPASRNALKVRSERGIFRFRVDAEDRDAWLGQIEEARNRWRSIPVD